MYNRNIMFLVNREAIIEDVKEKAIDNNDCTDGKIAGGLLGGGEACTGDGIYQAIPLE